MQDDSATIAPETEVAAELFRQLRGNTSDPPGITRASYGPGEAYAHKLLATTARGLDLDVTVDHAGNLYMTLPGRDRAAPAILIGSHLDSVPHGGNFDGAAGVVAGLTMLKRYRDLDRLPAQDITVMGVRAEEMSWFPVAYIGSRAALGLLPPEALEARRIDSRRTLADHMRDEGFDPGAVARGVRHLDPARLRCYVELHIEQGPALVQAGLPVGIVTGIRGAIRYTGCRAVGRYGHAGAVPRRQRQDALLAAVAFVDGLEKHWLDREGAGTDFVCTVGQFHTDASQHTVTKIPGEVRFTLDIRSEDWEVLVDTDRYLRATAALIAEQRGVRIELGDYAAAQPALMAPALRFILHSEASRLGIPVMDIASGAGHDCSVFRNQGVPSAMIFVRNDHGSHNPDEAMEIGDFADGCRLLAALLDRLG